MTFKVHIYNIVPLLISAKPENVAKLILELDRSHCNYSYTDKVLSILLKDAIDDVNRNIDELKENIPATFKVIEKFGICK